MPRTYPHCDARVLHAPRGYVDDGALVFTNGNTWKLCILPTAAAPWSPEFGCISLVVPVPTDTPCLAIRLTQPAWSALESKLINELSTFGQHQHRRNVVNAEPSTETGDVQNVSDSGVKNIRQAPKNVLNERGCREIVLPFVEPSFGTPDQLPAQIVTPVFLGTSWSLTIATAGERETKLLVNLSGKEHLTGSRLSWLSAIWSVLTAIESELTSEQWKQENERLSRGECPFCDEYASDLQEIRGVWGIAFSGHEPTDGQVACPADRARPPGSASDYNKWPGNRPEGYTVSLTPELIQQYPSMKMWRRHVRGLMRRLKGCGV